jgi:mannonate dehydratase
MIKLEQTMRWFGPPDPVSLADIRQAGCTGVVTALHHIPPGDVWSITEINIRKEMIEAAGLTWTVIESLPVHEDIKTQAPGFEKYIARYQESLENVAACGLKVVTYNFMPLLDWVRTDLDYSLPDGSRALRFQRVAFIAFDLFLLQRPGASGDYTATDIRKAEDFYKGLPEKDRLKLYDTVLQGLPGSNERFTATQVLQALKSYEGIDSARLKQHLFYFLRQVAPLADSLQLQLAIHPDDPPFPVLGLPRIMSTEADVEALLTAVSSPANGLCFCTGSFSARADNDLPGMVARWGKHIHFLHLRSTQKDQEGNFYEANHLEGDANIPAVMAAVILLMQQSGRSIPMRPDHGHQMLDDLRKTTYPGYSAIGRLKGLAELRGLEAGLAFAAAHNRK